MSWTPRNGLEIRHRADGRLAVVERRATRVTMSGSVWVIRLNGAPAGAPVPECDLVDAWKPFPHPSPEQTRVDWKPKVGMVVRYRSTGAKMALTSTHAVGGSDEPWWWAGGSEYSESHLLAHFEPAAASVVGSIEGKTVDVVVIDDAIVPPRPESAVVPLAESMTINETRERLGLGPIPDGDRTIAEELAASAAGAIDADDLDEADEEIRSALDRLDEEG